MTHNEWDQLFELIRKALNPAAKEFSRDELAEKIRDEGNKIMAEARQRQEEGNLDEFVTAVIVASEPPKDQAPRVAHNPFLQPPRRKERGTQ